MSVLRSTDLPVPEGPSITQISPAGMVRVTSPQISCLPKLLGQVLDLDLDAHGSPLPLDSVPVTSSSLDSARTRGSPHPEYQRVAGG